MTNLTCRLITMEEIEDRRDGKDRRQIHEQCTAHSGLNAKINVLIVLSSIVTICAGISIPMLSSIQSEVAKNTERSISAEKERDKMEERIRVLERVSREGYYRSRR